MTEGKPSAQDEKCKRTHDEARDLFDPENGRKEGQKKKRKKKPQKKKKKERTKKRKRVGAGRRYCDLLWSVSRCVLMTLLSPSDSRTPK